MNREAGKREPIARVAIPRLNSVLIGERLQSLRNASGLTGKELAKATGIPHGTIGGIESGRTLPDPHRLVAFAALFGVSVDFILTGEPVPSETTAEDGASNES